jgi:hypothetical protein
LNVHANPFAVRLFTFHPMHLTDAFLEAGINSGRGHCASLADWFTAYPVPLEKRDPQHQIDLQALSV